MITDDFGVQVGKIVAQAQEKARVAFVATAFEALTRVKELTPVDTGWLRSNWQIQREGEEAPVQRGALPTDPVEATAMLERLREEAARDDKSVGAVTERAAEAQLGEKLRIINPVIYARAIEYGREIELKDGGTATTRAAGMVAQTVAEVPQIAKAIVEAITEGRAR